MTLAQAAMVAGSRRRLREGEAEAIRVQAGLSQGDIARALGVTAGAVSRREAGTRVPRGALAVRYARLLELLERERDQ